MRAILEISDPRIAPAPEWIERMRARYPNERFVDRALVRKLKSRLKPRYRPLTVDTARTQLDAFLSSKLDGAFEVLDLLPLAGGASKEQFSFRLRWHENDTPRDERLVLRMQPEQATVETHRQREFQALQVLSGFIPVPEPYWLDGEAEIFQQPALIYGFCHGVVRPPDADAAYTVRGGFGSKWRAILAPQFIDILAQIHTFDHSGKDLSAFDIPAAGNTEAIILGLNLWQRSWEEDRIEAIPLMTLAAQWLRENAPPVDHVSMVHCDYRGGNFLFDPDSGKITAILDWECVRFGDRHEDLALLMSPALSDYDSDGTQLVGGFCPREEFIARYEAKSGLVVDPLRLAYYELYIYWRSVVMCIGSGLRCAVAQKSHQDIVVAFNSILGGLMLGDLHKALEKAMKHGT